MSEVRSKVSTHQIWDHVSSFVFYNWVTFLGSSLGVGVGGWRGGYAYQYIMTHYDTEE